MCAGLGSDTGIMTGISPDVEHAPRVGLCERPFHERGLACMILRAVVARGGGVVAPAGGARRRGESTEGAPQLLQCAPQNVCGHIRRLLADGADAIGRGGIRFALEQMRQGDERAQRCCPAAAQRQMRIEIGGLVAIAALDGCSKRPAKIAVSGEGKQKRADELTVGEPDGISRLACIEREHVDKDGLGIAEENVERGGVLKDEASGDGLFTEVEGQLACSGPLPGRPLPGIGRIVDALVFEQQRTIRIACSNRGGNHPAAAHPSACKGGGEKRVRRSREGGTNMAKDLGLIKVK